MRFIDKSGPEPLPLAEFKSQQGPLQVNMTYKHGFNRQSELRGVFIQEQFGLCAFTGVTIDERLGLRNGAGDVVDSKGRPLRMQAHIAHIKSQTDCIQELHAAYPNPPRPFGEDMDHRNMVAALEVNATRDHQFGASYQGRRSLPVDAISPVQPACDTAFEYLDSGEIVALNDAAAKTISELYLHHDILSGWRRGAVDGWFDPTVPDLHTPEYLASLAKRIMEPVDGKLEEFCFVIRSVALSRLNATADE